MKYSELLRNDASRMTQAILTRQASGNLRNGTNVCYRNELNFNNAPAIVHSWMKEQIKAKAKRLTWLALRAHMLDVAF